MRYLGGKSKLAKKIAPVVVAHAEGRRHYLEPFIGGGSTFAALAQHFDTASAGDSVEDLALMWRGITEGWWQPPTTLTEDEYRRLRHAEPSPTRAFAAFGCSFGGKWFGGYAHGRGRDYAAESARRLCKMRDDIAKCPDVLIRHADYRDWQVAPDTAVYCDPPYQGTTGYGAAGGFDHEEFWDTVRKWTLAGAAVLVSEFTAPDDFVAVLEIPRRIAVEGTSEVTKVDKVFVWDGQ